MTDQPCAAASTRPAGAPRMAAIPASFFGMVLGLAGLGNCWRVATKLWQLPSWIGEAIMLIAAVVWAVVLALFIAKWLWSPKEARAEFAHPVLCCFIGLGPVSTALIALAFAPYLHAFAVTLWVVGVTGQLAFGVYRTGRLWMGGRDPNMTTPILYLPTVAGSFVSAIVGGALGFHEWAVLFFGAGLFSWLALESIIMHRLFMHAELPPPLRPTLGIQLAPPTVGCVAYLSITSGAPDRFAVMLLGYGVLQALILVRLIPWIRHLPFAAPYWAFTFGVAALALGAMRCVERGLIGGPVQVLAIVAFVAANVIIGGIALGSGWLLIRGKLVPPPLLSIQAS